MGIVFFCQSCGARFEVDPRMAGKKGRCKKCSQPMTIPRAEEIASMVAMPALAAAAVGVGAASDARAGNGGASIGAWLKRGISNVGLEPLTVNRMPLYKKKPDPLDDAEDSKPYVLAKPLVETRGRVRVQDNVVLRVWRRQLGGIQKVFRVINETLYLISTPFIMVFILGVAVRSQQMAWLGAVVVVVLNVGRLVSGVANLAIVPFRDGIALRKARKPLQRVLGPALTIGLVACAFLFIPWLHKGGSEKAKAGGFFGAGGSFERKVQEELDKAGALGGEQPGSPPRATPTKTSRSTGATPAPANPIRDLIKDVGNRARETINEAQQQP